jgi:hypothetical protein
MIDHPPTYDSPHKISCQVVRVKFEDAGHSKLVELLPQHAEYNIVLGSWCDEAEHRAMVDWKEGDVVEVTLHRQCSKDGNEYDQEGSV